MKLLSESTLQVVTAGTPVQITIPDYAQGVTVINNYSDTRIFSVGKQATVDALSTPPIGVVLGAGDSANLPADFGTANLWLDASVSGSIATIQIYG